MGSAKRDFDALVRANWPERTSADAQKLLDTWRAQRIYSQTNQGLGKVTPR